ncbi:MAG: FixG Ig-like domain-containing protein [Fimbriimonadaceae bacterium]
MSFATRLVSDPTVLETGTSTPIDFEVHNTSDAEIRVEFDVQGLDPEWVSTPIPSFTVGAGETHTERFFVKAPRTSESRADNYPFVVSVRSLTTGDIKELAGVARIKPFTHLSVDLKPRRNSVSPVRKEAFYEVTVSNLGNTDQVLKIFASDPDDQCRFEWDFDEISVAPGESKAFDLAAYAAHMPVFGGGKSHVFTVSVRNVEQSGIQASTQGQLDVRPMVSPLLLSILVFFIIVAAAIWFTLPKPSTLRASVLETDVFRGDVVTVEWKAQNADSVRITAGGQIFEGLPLEGTQRVSTEDAGKLLLVEVTAVVRDRPSTTRTLEVVLQDRPETPLPTIEQFSANQTEVPLNSPVIFSYTLGPGVTRAFLSPPGVELDLRLTSYTWTPNVAGKVNVTLTAENAEGATTRREVTLNVVEKSEASIVKFGVKPTTLEFGGGDVLVEWQTSGAVRVEISVNGSSSIVDPMQGSRQFYVSETSNIQITAYDQRGRTVTQSARVEVAAAPQPPPDPAPVEPMSDTPPAGSRSERTPSTIPASNDAIRAAFSLR